MTPEQFCYWLQGFAEVSYSIALDTKQWQEVKDHLATVFHKVTPVYVPQVFPNPLNALDRAIC